MAKMHELLAVLSDAANAANVVLAETAATFSKRADHFKGQTRTVTFFAEDRQGENTVETKEIVTSVDDKLAYTLDTLGKHWDALFQMEATNQRASADLIVAGETLASDVPATFLLGMEQRLKELRQTLLMIPTLAPELSWSEDAGAGKGVYISPPQVNFKTEKQVRHKVLYDATDKHPAQIEKWNEDVPVARIETVHRSTMLSPRDKHRMLTRLDMLLSGVKQARQRANTVEVDERRIAETLADFILDT